MQELRLDKMLELNGIISEIDEQIKEIQSRIYSPKNQVISDMPKGGGVTESVIDKALLKIDKLNKRKDYYYRLIASEWLICKGVLKSCNITEKQIQLMHFRFFNGLSWRKCVKAMQAVYPKEKWNENKAFRIYRQIVAMCIKNDIRIC